MSENEETWIEIDAEAGSSEPTAAAALLEGFADTLREAPEGCRYDVKLQIDERHK